jgi:hypothetical protein
VDSRGRAARRGPDADAPVENPSSRIRASPIEHDASPQTASVDTPYLLRSAMKKQQGLGL